MKKLKEKGKIITLSAIYAVFFLTAGMGIVNPAIQGIAEAFPDIPLNTIMQVSTLPSLFLIPATIISGILAGDKVKFRTLLIIAIVLFIVAGVLPAFLSSFTAILVARAVVGIGIGIIFPLSSALVIRLFDGPSRANIMGIGNFVSSLAGVILQMLGGILVTISWDYTFYAYLLGIISLVLVFIGLPEPEKVEKIKQDNKAKLPIEAIVIAVLSGIGFLLLYPLIVSLSTIITTNNMGTGTAAGLALSLFTFGGMISTAIFGKLYQVMGKFTYSFDVIATVVGMAIVYNANSIIAVYVGMVIVGIGYLLVIPTFMMEIGKIVAPSKIPLASGLIIAFMNAGSFISTYYISLVGKITGNMDITYPIFISMIVFVIIAIIYTIVKLSDKKTIKPE